MRKDEYIVCKSIATYMKLQYPNVEFRFDQAGLNLSRTQRGMNKAIQHSRGYPDLFIAEPTKDYNGLYIEVKIETPFKKSGEIKASKNDRLKIQWEKLEVLNSKGYFTAFGVGFDHCKKIIDNYLCNNT